MRADLVKTLTLAALLVAATVPAVSQEAAPAPAPEAAAPATSPPAGAPAAEEGQGEAAIPGPPDARPPLDAEMEARRRADHLVAGLTERLPELAATVEDAPVGDMQAPPAHVQVTVAPESVWNRLRRLLGR